jgi:hypothetical protein
MRLLGRLACAPLLFAAACAPAAAPAHTSPAPAPSAASAHRKRQKHHDPRPSEAGAGKIDLSKAVIQNARDADDRLILALGDTCKIEVPPSGPELAAHEYEEVDCPADYDDDAWDDCAFILTRAPSGCYCVPSAEDSAEPPKPTACPKLERGAR